MASDRPPSPCAHCGLPVVAGQADAGPQFCCAACETVYGALRSDGLEQFYAARDACAVAPQPARSTGRDYAEFDDPAFAAAHIQQQPDRSTVSLVLDGVHCAACLWIVERLPHVVPGVVDSRLDLPRATVHLAWNPDVVALSAIARRLDRFGYPPHLARAGDRDDREVRDLILRGGVAWAISANVMMLSVTDYVGAWSDMDAATTHYLRSVCAVLTLPSLLWAARPFYEGVRASWTVRRLHMDVPIALGIVAGYAGGLWNVARGDGPVWFDSVASLIFLLLAGRLLQTLQRRRSQRVAELLFCLAPGSARKLDRLDDHGRDVSIASLVPGDLVAVRAGDSFAVDGVVAEGRSTVDRALLSGESRPVAVGPGDLVFAGTTNLGARLVVRATAAGETTRMGQLLRAVDEALVRKAPIVALADAIVGRFVFAVLGLATLTAALWLAIDPSLALDHTVALLVATCPCALGLATPLAVHVALGRAARQGIYVKGGDALEALAGKGTIYFDKTGTLTQGRLSVVAQAGDGQALQWAAALEAESAHPVAAALRTLGPAQPTRDVQASTGAGVRGMVAGHLVVVGRPAWVAHQATAAPGLLDRCAHWAERGHTPVAIAVDGQLCAAAAVGDAVRPDAQPALSALQAAGWQVRVLSGDHSAAVAAVARSLGIDGSCAQGDATPERKLEVIRTAAALGPVVMVGDGVNDAAALAAATVGIHVHGGAEAGLRAADVFLTRPGVGGVVELVQGARGTLQTIRKSIGLSLGYNVVCVALAMSGWLSPLVAAVLMPLSSLAVVSLALRGRGFRDPMAGTAPEAQDATLATAAPAAVEVAPWS
ncbi:MAG: heavy metal translocating P-type ATPase [Deltaproteobacteria bacterium]|nr:heavy metal translocating P-type ATPase [Deltaproteobacteria bacterium]